MDKDDTPDKLFENYKNGSTFKNSWWGKKGYIIPIYFYPNMDFVFAKHGFEIDTSRDKSRQYTKLLSSKSDDIIEMLKKLPKNESKIGTFIKYIEDFRKNIILREIIKYE